MRGFNCNFFTRESFRETCTPDVPGRDSLVAIAEPYENYLKRVPYMFFFSVFLSIY